MATKLLSRQELYDLVWDMPMRRLATSFGMSDVALAKHCKKAGIPLPGLGYWAKRDAGKAPARVALTPRGLGQSDRISLGVDTRSGYPIPPEEIVLEEIPELQVFEGDLAHIRSQARSIVGTVAYPSLARPHPLVAKLLEEDERRRAKQKASSWPSSFDAPFFDSGPEKRRLRIMNALFLALARCGSKPWTTRKESYELGAQIGDVPMRFILAPIGFNRSDHDRYGKVFENKGKLMLELDWYEPPAEIPSRWEDKDDMPLEARLSEITADLLAASEWALRDHAKRQHAHLVDRKARAEEELAKRAEEARRKERERKEKIARDRREQLFAEAEALRRAIAVRTYIAARLERAKQIQGKVDEALNSWALWALGEADQLDPLSGSVTPPAEA